MSTKAMNPLARQRTGLFRLKTLDAFVAHRDYRLLGPSNLLAMAATWMQLLTAGWLMTDLMVDSASLGVLVLTVGGIFHLPGLVVGPWAGVLGDRVSRRCLMAVTYGTMGLVGLAFSMVVGLELVEWWQVYIYILLGGVCFSVGQPFRDVLVANTVPKQDLGNAYALNRLMQTTGRLSGPFFGGLVIASVGFDWALVLEASIFLLAALAFFPMRLPYAASKDKLRNCSPLGDLWEGIRWVWQDGRPVLYLILLIFIPIVILYPVLLLLPVFVSRVFSLGPDSGGLLLSASGLGGLAAALTIASMGFVIRKGLVVLGVMALSSACTILFSQIQWFPLGVLLIGIMGFCLSTFLTASSTLIQTLTPDYLRGRVTSLQKYPYGFVLLTGPLLGWLVDSTDVKMGVTAAGILGLGLSLMAWVTLRQVRKLD